MISTGRKFVQDGLNHTPTPAEKIIKALEARYEVDSQDEPENELVRDDGQFGMGA